MAKLTLSRKFAEAHFLPGRVRRWAGNFVFWAFAILYFMAVSVLLVRLGSMRLDGLAATGLAVLAVSFAFSSLLYNRARAHPNGQLQRRSLLAAEHATRANLWFVIAFAIGAATFFALDDFGYNVTNSCVPLPRRPLGCRTLPGFLAFAVCIPLLAGLTAFSTALKILLSKAIAFLLTPSFVRRSVGEHRKIVRPSPSISLTSQQIEQIGELNAQNLGLEKPKNRRLHMWSRKLGSQQGK